MYGLYAEVAGERLKIFRESSVDGRRNEGKTVGEPASEEERPSGRKERLNEGRRLVTAANQSARLHRLFSNPAFRPRIVYKQPIRSLYL